MKGFSINMKELEKCCLCPRNCEVNRLADELGRCRVGVNPKIALANLHFYEEPCISGKEGSGTVFFSGCNLSCMFCQNYRISQEFKGEEIKVQDLSDIFLKLQAKGANNINLVTGFMFVPQIIEALKIAKAKGLNIPVVYNTSGYEAVSTLKMLDGYIDIYLPDFKYAYNDLAENGKLILKRIVSLIYRNCFLNHIGKIGQKLCCSELKPERIIQGVEIKAEDAFVFIVQADTFFFAGFSEHDDIAEQRDKKNHNRKIPGNGQKQVLELFMYGLRLIHAYMP